MPATNFPHGITSFGMPVFGGGGLTLPLMGGKGKVFYVDPSYGSDGSTGLSANLAMDSVSAAYAKTVDKRGDIIYLMPGHAESVTAAAGLDLDVAGVKHIGLGNGTSRPTVTLGTLTTADVDIDAINQTIENVRFVSAIKSVAVMVDVNFGNLHMENPEQVNALRDEALARWNYYKSPINKALIPSSVIQLANAQAHGIVVDQSRHRLFFFENRSGVPVYVDDFYVTIGKEGAGKSVEGDQKTPLGVYFVTRFIDSDELPDLYGDGAFPINYPNIWDRRSGRTGTGIWLHGTPNGTFSRPPDDSDGCVIISNDDLNTLAPYIGEGQTTPVILAQEIEWVTKTEWQQRRNNFYGHLEQWRKDWESRDAGLYLRHYSKDYEGLGKNYESWVAHKRRVNPSKSFIKVDLIDTSIFLYPNGTDPILVMTFLQNYSSDNFHRVYRKRQYWRMEEDGNWRIIFEGSV